MAKDIHNLSFMERQRLLVYIEQTHQTITMFGTILRTVREAKGWSHEQLSDAYVRFHDQYEDSVRKISAMRIAEFETGHGHVLNLSQIAELLTLCETEIFVSTRDVDCNALLARVSVEATNPQNRQLYAVMYGDIFGTGGSLEDRMKRSNISVVSLDTARVSSSEVRENGEPSRPAGVAGKDPEAPSTK